MLPMGGGGGGAGAGGRGVATLLQTRARCSMRETRETALLHAWVQSACLFIYSTKLP